MKNLKKEQSSQVGDMELIRITAACNVSCLFCSIPKEDYEVPYERSLKDVCLDIDGVKKRNARMGISLSGGEPTIHSKLFEIVEYAKGIKINPIEIQTNALRFADGVFAEKIKNAGVSKLFVSFHSHEEAVSDYLTRVDGAWKKSVDGIKNAIKAGINVTLNPVLNEKSFKHFPEYIKFINKEFPEIKNISISVVQPQGRAKKNDFLLPDYGEMTPYIKNGLKLADGFGIKANNPYCGLPLCFGSWNKRLSNNLEYNDGIARLRNPEDVPAFKGKIKIADCQKCSLNAYCNGVWKDYLKVYPNLTVNPIMKKKKAETNFNDMESISKDHSQDKRHWVRLTMACNNRCIFCLDRRSVDGAILSVDEVKKDLVRGRQLGVVRVVLSGGEATIHPKFLDIVKIAKDLGYEHIQVITNGRMFSYMSFLKQAVEAGLDEVTFSMHGHLPTIHDELTGINGSFVQAFSGLRNALAIKNLIISVDVVLNKKNIEHLYEILTFYIDLGVYEFDLLNVVPFGRAWDNWNELWYDIDKYSDIIQKVLKLSEDSRLHIWTNRFPLEHLEGYERMIQPPAKLLDEINGNRRMFSNFILKDIEMECYGERCQFCFIKGMCHSLRELKTRKTIKSYPQAPCLNEKIREEVLSLTDILNINKVDLNKFGNFYIENMYRTKKSACSACSQNNFCKGVLVSRIKRDGFIILKPQ